MLLKIILYDDNSHIKRVLLLDSLNPGTPHAPGVKTGLYEHCKFQREPAYDPLICAGGFKFRGLQAVCLNHSSVARMTVLNYNYIREKLFSFIRNYPNEVDFYPTGGLQPP